MHYQQLRHAKSRAREVDGWEGVHHYSEYGEEDETAWMKLTMDNMFRICCVGTAETATCQCDTVIRAPNVLASSLAAVVGQLYTVHCIT
jgi:hypothetical protein